MGKAALTAVVFRRRLFVDFGDQAIELTAVTFDL